MKKGENQKMNKTCFVIMPIGELTTYPQNHFRHIYEDLFSPAIEEVGFMPKRADDYKSSSLIHVNVVREIIEAPMAICDLSTRNPNVLFELGIRQAFDLPVVLVQEVNTPRIFDISVINTIDYRKELIYREVLEDRIKIRNAIEATKDKNGIVNSLIKLLNIEKANNKSIDELEPNDEIKFMLHTIMKNTENMKNNDYYIDDLRKTECQNIKYTYFRPKKKIDEMVEISQWVKERFNNEAEMLFDELSVVIEIKGNGLQHSDSILSEIKRVLEV